MLGVADASDAVEMQTITACGHAAAAPRAATLLITEGPPSGGGGRLGQARRLIESDGADRPGRPRCRTGRPDAARAELATAVGMLREMGMSYWLPEAERELAGASA